MPKGNVDNKYYGKHNYGVDTSGGVVNCAYGCGCWIDDDGRRSGGPIGLDARGVCPNNSKDGIYLGGEHDYRRVVEMRIKHLEQQLKATKKQLKAARVKNSKLYEGLSVV